MPRDSDFLERSCLEKNPHLPQHFNTIRRDLLIPGIEKQSFGQNDREMIA